MLLRLEILVWSAINGALLIHGVSLLSPERFGVTL